jgi:ABC-type glycerol-3-phosphate transport system substrate-binding protein
MRWHIARWHIARWHIARWHIAKNLVSEAVSSLLLLLLVAGCAGGMPELATDARATSVSPLASIPTDAVHSPPLPIVTPTPTQEAQPMIVTIGLWLPEELDPYGAGPGADVLARQLNDFSEAYPDVQVEVTVKKAHGRGGLFDFLRTAQDAAPSVLPDLVVVDADELATTASSGLIQALDDLLSPTEINGRFPFAIELGTVAVPETDEMATMGLIIGVDMEQVAYRPGLFDSRPISWTQVVSPPVPMIFAASGRDREVNDATLIQYLAAGGKLTDPEGQPYLDADVMVSVLDFYSDCMGTGTISPTVVLGIADADQAWERFQAGEGGMTVVRAGRYWPWAKAGTDVADIDRASGDGVIAATSIPTRDGHPFSIARGWAIAMVADDPARQALAMMLLEWLIAPAHNAEWTQAAGYLPGTRDTLRTWNVSNADRAMLRGMMEAAVPEPPQDAMATAGRVMQEALVAVLRRRATPEEAVKAAVESLGP